MGKKIRYQYLTGSLKEPLFQFINKLEFAINPMADPRGTQIANHWYRMAKNTKSKFKGENFEQYMNYDLSSSSSYVLINFVNGWKQGFYFREATNETFISMTKNANKMIACTSVSR